MKSFFRKSFFILSLSLGFISQAGFAQARAKLVWMGIEAAIKASERSSDQSFDGLSKMLVKQVKLSEIRGLSDSEAGAMFESIRLAASNAGKKDVRTMDDFMAALAADPQLKASLDRVLAKVDDSATTLSAEQLAQLNSANLGNLVNETARSQQNKIEIGASNIIPCEGCGITQAMRHNGVSLYLRRASAPENQAIVNAAKSGSDVVKATRTEISKVENEAGAHLKFSSAGDTAFAALSISDKSMIHQLTSDANAIDQDTQSLARSFIKFSRDGEQSVNLAPDGDRLFAMYTNMSKDGKSGQDLKKMIDDINQQYPKAEQLGERRMAFCKTFRQTAQATAKSQAAMRVIDNEGCFGNILKICQ